MTLSSLDLENKIAQRYYHKRNLGVPKDTRGSSLNDPVDIEIQSGLAEKFAADLLGCQFNIEITDSGDEGYDFIYKGHKVDVKWLGYIKGSKQPRLSGRIIVDLHKLTCDIYVAVTGSKEKGFQLAGWCTKDDIISQPIWLSDYPDQKGKFERYAIHTKDLRN